MTDAGFPPTESECKHMQQVSELDEQDLMTQRLIYREVQQLLWLPPYTVRKDRLNPPNDMV